MAKAQWCGSYDAAQLLLDRCLRRDGSLFSEAPDRPIWTADLAAELEGRVGSPDTSEASFMEKLDGQLDGLDAEAIQLAAELLYVELLGENDTGGDLKEEHVNHVLGLVPGTTPMPETIRQALHAGGVARYGAGKSNRDAFLRFLVQFVLAWKGRDPEEQRKLAESPWETLELVNGIRTSTDAMQANALLHLLFPETFEYMISPTHREKLITTFAAAPGVTATEGVERQIQEIRQVASAALGREVELYEKPFHEIWRETASPQWQELLKWARRVYEWPGFDDDERDYKLRLGEKLAAARAAEEEEWLDQLAAAFKDSENNITDWRAYDDFVKWCREHAQEARAILDQLWDAADDPQTAIAGFLEATPREAVSGPGTRLNIATFLMLGSNPTGTPLYKSKVHRGFLRLVDRTMREPVDSEVRRFRLLRRTTAFRRGCRTNQK